VNDNEAIGERRRAQRKSVMLSAQVSRAGVSKAVRLTNISSEGASIVGGDLPPRSVDVHLQRDGAAIRARVMWTRGRSGGVRFDQAVDVPQLLRPVPRARLVQPPCSRRPALSPQPLSQAERASIERCCNLLGIRGWN